MTDRTSPSVLALIARGWPGTGPLDFRRIVYRPGHGRPAINGLSYADARALELDGVIENDWVGHGCVAITSDDLKTLVGLCQVDRVAA